MTKQYKNRNQLGMFDDKPVRIEQLNKKIIRQSKRKCKDGCGLCAHEFYCDRKPKRDDKNRCISFSSIYLFVERVVTFLKYGNVRYENLTNENRVEFNIFLDKIRNQIKEVNINNVDIAVRKTMVEYEE